MKRFTLIVGALVVVIVVGLVVAYMARRSGGKSKSTTERMDAYDEIDRIIETQRSKNGMDITILASESCPVCKQLIEENPRYRKYVVYGGSDRARDVMRHVSPALVPAVAYSPMSLDSTQGTSVAPRILIEGYEPNHSTVLLKKLRELNDMSL